MQRKDSLENILSLTDQHFPTNKQQLNKKTTNNNNNEKESWAVVETTEVSRFHEVVPELAHDYPFELDTFQKQAVMRLERGECVFVSAHTSAGKTVVAEYAVALAIKHMTRAVYTSPIKTLSNQKFREFKQTFGDVGLMTGDMTIQPDASCLILTTEILRAMLYKGADLIRDIEWVIFDEVHYINDQERGVVWEETIIMLPDHVGIILLSASVPNTADFADWVGRTKQKQIHVITTDKRPVPLQHHLHTCGKLHKIMDGSGTFQNVGYKAATMALKASQTSKSGRVVRPSGAARDKSALLNWVNLINDLEKDKQLPMVCFAFSKRRCEECASCLYKTDLTTSKEKSEINVFITTCLTILSKTDRNLPQVTRMKELLTRGIGLHHAGLLPIMKEVVEMLFSKGLVKVLFATETFAMGVNMPARTVVFNGVRKHDGKEFRDLNTSEYQQMSGRAGRRGLDRKGMVIILAWDEIPEEFRLQKMLRGKPMVLESKFRLTYNMIVNLLRVEDFRVEDIMKRSFSEVMTQRKLPGKEEILALGREHLQHMEPFDCLFGQPAIEEYYDSVEGQENVHISLRDKLVSGFTSTVVPGRFCLIQTSSFGQCLGFVVDRTEGQDGKTRMTRFLAISTDTLATQLPPNSAYGRKYLTTSDLVSANEHAVGDTRERQGETGFVGEVEWALVDVNSFAIRSVTSSKLTRVDANLVNRTDPVAVAAVVAFALEMIEKEPAGPKVLDEVNDLKNHDIDFVEQYELYRGLTTAVHDSKCHTCPRLQEQFSKASRRGKLRRRLGQLSHALSDDSLHLLPDFHARVNVLETLKYIDSERTVLLKGRVACEINSVDELLATELIFDDAWGDLNADEIVAILSSMLCKEKDDNDPNLTDNLKRGMEATKAMAKKLGEVQLKHGLAIDPQEEVSRLNTALVEVVYEWTRGMAFAEILKLTSIQEGSIVRTITRLDVACGEIKSAARVIGNAPLYQKMELASQKIKRDIVFAASLYVQ